MTTGNPLTKTALLVIDVQVGLFEDEIPIYNAQVLFDNINLLLKGAYQAGSPVIYIQHIGEEGDALHPSGPGFAIHPVVAPNAGDLHVHKSYPDSFQETPLQVLLEGLQVRRLVIAGLQTEYCIDATCRRAFSLGYQVNLAADAHSTCDTSLLSAAQIIAHHNLTLNGTFAEVLPTDQIRFE